MTCVHELSRNNIWLSEGSSVQKRSCEMVDLLINFLCDKSYSEENLLIISGRLLTHKHGATSNKNL